MGRVIVDTSFLSSLVKSNLLDLSLEIIGESEIYITEIVKGELEQSRIYEDNKDIIAPDGTIIVLKYKKVENTNHDLSFLGAGEASCINYCLENDAKLLVDDREARDEANELSIKTLTIPDLLLLGKRKEKILKEEMESAIKSLKKNDSYLFSEDVKDKLLEYS
ncbi:MAG: hypothetical protein ACOC7O_02455 [Thermoplasmatota archaeon]